MNDSATHLLADAEVSAYRLDAAQQEWERNDRVRRVVLVATEMQIDRAKRIGAGWLGDPEIVVLIAMLEGIAEVLRGTWLKSPQDMAALRAAGESDARK